MGLFDRLFGRKPEPEPEPQPEPQPEPPRDVGPQSPREALESVVAVLGAREVRTDPDGSDECEVRGSVTGRPARVELDDRRWLKLELKGAIGMRMIMLVRDSSKIPKAADADDPWDEGGVRTFVSKGVYAEGDAETVEGYVGRLDGLSEPVRAALFSAMRELFSDDVPAVFHAAGDQIALSGKVEFGAVKRVAEVALPMLAEVVRDLEQLPDPLAALMQAGQPGTAGPAEATAAEPPAPAPRQVKCEYCRSRFVATWDFNCPNCGAPSP